MASVKIATNDEIKAGFIFPTLTKITGEPTYNSIKKIETQIIRNAATVECRVPQPHQSLCGLFEQPQVYILRVGKTFPILAYPGDTPAYPNPCTPEQKQAIDTIYNLTLRYNLTCSCLDNISKTMIENAIDNKFLAGIHTEEHGFGARSTRDVLDWLYRTYGKLSPGEITKNNNDLHQPVDPTKPITTIWQQIENCQGKATAAGAPFTDEQILRAAEQLLVATGLYNTKH